jgi:hypothetical protein
MEYGQIGLKHQNVQLLVVEVFRKWNVLVTTQHHYVEADLVRVTANRHRNVMNKHVQVTIHLIAYKINFRIPHYTLIEMSSVDNFIMHIRIS